MNAAEAAEATGLAVVDGASGAAAGRILRERGAGSHSALVLAPWGRSPARLAREGRVYHQHPQARAELATQDGLARVQHGTLTTG